VDVLIDNTDVHNLRVIYNKSLDNYYKEIGLTNFFDLTVTNKTQYQLFEKPRISNHPRQNIKRLLIASVVLLIKIKSALEIIN
jgi:hypothetical protein